MMFRLLCFSLALALTASSVQAQQSSTPLGAADSVFMRARQLVANGNGAAGRALVDSMVTVATPDTPAYAEALYWRASLASTSAEAEQDLRRIAVEYPLSIRAGDALLRLAQLEIARGDKAAATTHLDRFLLENPQHAERSQAGLQLIRLEFEQGNAPRGCTILGRTLRGVPASEVELRNQITYYAPRCAGVDTTRAPQRAADKAAADSAAADSAAAAKRAATTGKKSKRETPKRETPKRETTKGDTTKRETTKGETTKGDTAKRETTKGDTAKRAAVKGDTSRRDTVVAAKPSQGRYTLQVAAYSTRTTADRLAARLKDLGLDSRVVPFENGFRVRVGHYKTRAAATAAAKQLKTKKIDATVTEAGPDDQ